jgi:adenylosuccinate lyase
MLANLDKMKGLVFSQAVLLALTSAGLTREEAYAIVQRNAMAVWEKKGTFKEMLSADPELRKVLDRDAFETCFAPERFLKHVDTIYERVFGRV